MVWLSEEVCQLCPGAFHAETSSVLAASQAQSRRVIGRLAKAQELPDDFRLFAVYREGLVVGAMCYELRRSYLCVAGTVTVTAARSVLTALREELGADAFRLHGCDGPPVAVEAISTACKEAFGCLARSGDLLETMILDMEPRAAVGVPGKLRRISPQSKLLPILALWFEQFEKDTDQESFSLKGHRQIVAHLADAASRQDLFTWEVKDKPVTMAILGRTHPKQLLCVYTPLHQRSRGYGQAVTAAVCTERWQQTGGVEPIILSAVHKFGAARIYQRVGFRSAGWLHGVTFEDCCGDAARSVSASADLSNAADLCEKAFINTDVDVDTDVCTDAGTDLETTTDTEASEVDLEGCDQEEEDEELDLLDAACWDLETDPAKLFASSYDFSGELFGTA